MIRSLSAGLAASGLLLSGAAAGQGIGEENGEGVTTATQAAFFVTLDRDDAEEIILRAGGLRLVARCDLGGGLNGDRVALIVESRIDDWFVVRAGRITTRDRRAGDEVALAAARAPAGTPLLEGVAGREIALAPDGTFLSLAAGSAVLGVNVLGHRCVAIGRVDAIRGAPRSARDDLFDDDGLRFGFDTGDDDGFRFRFDID